MPEQHGSARPTAGAGRLLALVRARRATTRQALTAESGLARSTVAHRLEQLVDAGLLVDAGTVASTGGRRPGAFAFNRHAGVVLVAALGGSTARFACCDLEAEVLADERRDIDIGAGPGPLLDLVRERLAAVLEAAGRDGREVLGVALGVPGPVDFAAGRVVSPPIMTGWDELDIREALALPYAGPVLVDNDANLMALGEHRERHRAEPHLLFVKAGTGIGAGIVAAGALHRGAQGAAGDIGHIRGPGLDGLCRCGMTGCVEASAGGWAIARDLRHRGFATHGVRDVVALLRTHEPVALDLLGRSARVLGAAVADVVSIVNPSTVVLGGELAHADPRLLAGVREVVYARSLPLATRSLRFDLSALGDRAGVVGGAHLVLEDRLAPEAVERLLDERERDGAGRLGPGGARGAG